MTSSPNPGRPHSSSGPHSAHRETNPVVSYEIFGTIRWLDIELKRMVVGVRGTHGHAGGFQGQDVTVDLEPARLRGTSIDELVPGTEVRVKARLRRNLGRNLPDLLPATSVALA